MKSQHGLSQIELILIVGVIGVITAAIVVRADNASDKARVERVASATEDLVRNLETAIGQRRSYHALTTAAVMEKGLVPAVFDYDGQVSTPWGPVRIGSTGTMHNGLRLTFEAVPARHCADFVSRLAPMMVSVQVNGRRVGQDRRIDGQAVAQACKGGGLVVADRVEEQFGQKAPWETWAPEMGTGPVEGSPIEPIPPQPIATNLFTPKGGS